MFYGLDWIATVPPTVRLTAQRFGPERANLVFGWIFAGHQLGAATAAFGAGPVADRARDLSAGVLRRRRAVHRRGADHAGDLAAGEAGGGVKMGEWRVANSECTSVRYARDALLTIRPPTA